MSKVPKVNEGPIPSQSIRPTQIELTQEWAENVKLHKQEIRFGDGGFVYVDCGNVTRVINLLV